MTKAAIRWDSHARSPVALVLLPYTRNADGQPIIGTTVVKRDADGQEHGCRDITAGPHHDGILAAWIETAQADGLAVEDHRDATYRAQVAQAVAEYGAVPAEAARWSAHHAADRVKMARKLAEVVRAHGAEATVFLDGAPEIAFLGPTITRVEVKAAHGLLVSVDFNPKNVNGDTVLLHWNVDSSCPETRLASSFAPSVNPYHRRKATDSADSFPALAAIIARRLDAVQSGAAFLLGAAPAEVEPDEEMPTP